MAQLYQVSHGLSIICVLHSVVCMVIGFLVKDMRNRFLPQFFSTNWNFRNFSLKSCQILILQKCKTVLEKNI